MDGLLHFATASCLQNFDYHKCLKEVRFSSNPRRNPAPTEDFFHRNMLAKLCRGERKKTELRATDDLALTGAVDSTMAVVLDSEKVELFDTFPQ